MGRGGVLNRLVRLGKCCRGRPSSPTATAARRRYFIDQKSALVLEVRGWYYRVGKLPHTKGILWQKVPQIRVIMGNETTVKWANCYGNTI